MIDIKLPFFIMLTSAKKKDAVKYKYPTPSNPPNNINPKALSLHWKEFCKKYSKVWRKQEAGPDAWATCVAIWTNYCIKRKIMPFNPEESIVTPDIIEMTRERTINGRKAQLETLGMLTRTGKDRRLISRVYAETFLSCELTKPGIFEITTRQKVSLKPEITTRSQPFKQWMAYHAFENKRGIFKRGLKGGASIAIEGIKDKEEAEIRFVNTFTNAKLQYLLNLNSEAIKDTAKVKKALAAYWRKLMKTKIVKKKSK